MILDTRIANCHFLPPPLTRLPTAASLAAVEALAQQELYFAGGDIDNAFYRIGVPACAALSQKSRPNMIAVMWWMELR